MGHANPNGFTTTHKQTDCNGFAHDLSSLLVAGGRPARSIGLDAEYLVHHPLKFDLDVLGQHNFGQAAAQVGIEGGRFGVPTSLLGIGVGASL